ncbi:MAG: PAS domain S-box protein [Hyphomicrobium sp.]|uniref:hybrid sensor histidine kinase/response regulator n=1 Tax=Hyphomicrobium sp. TaxID=82 RepID=UPI0039E5A9C6
MLKAILESAVAAILAIDSSGRIQIVNPAAERMFGYSTDELLGKPINVLMPEPYQSQHDHYLQRHLATGEKKIIGIGREVRGLRKDGTVFPIHLSVGSFEVGGQRFFSGIINDMSAHARLQAEIDRQSLLFQAVFDHVPEALVIFSPDGEIILVNPAASRMFGYSADEFATVDLLAFFAEPGDLKKLEPQQGEPNDGRTISVTLRRRDGAKFPGQLHVADIVGADGSQIANVGLFRDMTEEMKQKEAALKSQRLEAIGQLSGGIAHDFNNLLTIISGNLELLEESIANPQDHDLLTRAARAADSGARLTNRLLTFARRRQLAAEVINLNEQVRGMTELLRRTLGDMIELRTHLAPDLWLARVDAAEVEAAVINLAINARDAMPDGGKLTIRTENATLDEGEIGFEGPLTAGEYVRISVSDDGTGMSKETLSRVFEPFFTTKPPGRGTGLGLSTIYGFVKQSQGNITIYSEPGVGTTINLYLPRSVDPKDAQQGPSTATAQIAAGENVLVVEDNRDVRALTVKRFERLGYRVVECVTGAEAKEALKNGLDVELVFTDIMMPGGMTGIDLGKWIAENRPGLPVILTTGFAEEIAGAAAPADETWMILRKPYAQKDLANIVRKAREKHPA